MTNTAECRAGGLLTHAVIFGFIVNHHRLQLSAEPLFGVGFCPFGASAPPPLSRHEMYEGGSRPESGYSVHYMAIPPTPSERQARVEEVTALFDVGLASPVDIILAQHPGMERAEAIAHLETIRQERALFPGVGGGQV